MQGVCSVEHLELSIYYLSLLWSKVTDFNNLGGSLWFCLYIFLITLHLSHTKIIVTSAVFSEYLVPCCPSLYKPKKKSFHLCCFISFAKSSSLVFCSFRFSAMLSDLFFLIISSLVLCRFTAYS